MKPIRCYIIPFVVLAAAERTKFICRGGVSPPVENVLVCGRTKALPYRGYIIPFAIRCSETYLKPSNSDLKEFRQILPQQTSEAVTTIAFSSGEGAEPRPRMRIASEADEESTAYGDEGSLRQIKLHLPITDYFSEMATSSSVNHGGRKQPHIRFASVIDTFSAGEGYGFGRVQG